MSDGCAFDFERFRYIELRGDGSKLPKREWGGYQQDFDAAKHVHTHEDVKTLPTENFGVVDVGDHAVAMATDPLSILPAIGLERAGRFGVQIILADVAVSGLSPSHLAVSFALPPDMSDEDFSTVWDWSSAPSAATCVASSTASSTPS